jgi:hypothetical protein
MSNIVLLTDTPTEALRKQLAEKIRPKSPEENRFEEYRRAGLDSETAAMLADWRPSPVDYAANAVRTSAMYEEPVDRLRYVSAMETTGSMRRIGEATGSAIGAALGIGTLKVVTAHAAMFTLAGVGLAGAVGAIVAGKLVAASMGKVAAAVTVLNIASATALIGFAIVRRK